MFFFIFLFFLKMVVFSLPTVCLAVLWNQSERRWLSPCFKSVLRCLEARTSWKSKTKPQTPSSGDAPSPACNVFNSEDAADRILQTVNWLFFLVLFLRWPFIVFLHGWHFYLHTNHLKRCCCQGSSPLPILFDFKKQIYLLYVCECNCNKNYDAVIFWQSGLDHCACVNDVAVHVFIDGLVQFYDGSKVIVREKGSIKCKGMFKSFRLCPLVLFWLPGI